MRAFEVRLNGKKLCLAGVSEGVLTTIIDSFSKKGRQRLHFAVSGLRSEANEDVTWRSRPLRVGDEITVKITEAETVDRPRIRRRRDPKEDERYRKAYVRQMAKKFGWKLTTGTSA